MTQVVADVRAHMGEAVVITNVAAMGAAGVVRLYVNFEFAVAASF